MTRGEEIHHHELVGERLVLVSPLRDAVDEHAQKGEHMDWLDSLMSFC